MLLRKIAIFLVLMSRTTQRFFILILHQSRRFDVCVAWSCSRCFGMHFTYLTCLAILAHFLPVYALSPLAFSAATAAGFCLHILHEGNN